MERSACLECPAKYFCPYATTEFPLVCPAGYYCPPRSVEPNKCPSLFHSDEQSENCKATLFFYVLVVLGAVFLVIGVLAVILWIRARQRAQQGSSRNHLMSKKEESHRLIPAPKDGPVYSGL